MLMSGMKEGRKVGTYPVGECIELGEGCIGELISMLCYAMLCYAMLCYEWYEGSGMKVGTYPVGKCIIGNQLWLHFLD